MKKGLKKGLSARGDHKYPGHYADDLMKYKGDPEKQKEIFKTIPESMKAPARSCYKRELRREQKANRSNERRRI